MVFDALCATDQHPDFVILVVPYTALTVDITNTCARRNISCQVWTDPTSAKVKQGGPRVMIVSLNQVTGDAFLQWAAGKEVQAAVRRVVIDEAHVLIDETFRKGHGDFGRLTSVFPGKQFTFLSATIPPTREAELEQATCLPVRFLRDTTNRANLNLKLLPVRNMRDAIEDLKPRLQAFGVRTDGISQALVICRTRTEANRVSVELNCDVFYSVDEREDPSRRTVVMKALQDFTTGLKYLLTGTPGLAVGVDRPHVRVVAMFGEPYSCLTLAQAAGRAGRDGEVADVLLYKFGDLTQPAPQGPLPRTDGEAIHEIMEGGRCLREPLSHWLDGRITNCLEVGGQLCSTCKAQWSDLQATKEANGSVGTLRSTGSLREFPSILGKRRAETDQSEETRVVRTLYDSPAAVSELLASRGQGLQQEPIRRGTVTVQRTPSGSSSSSSSSQMSPFPSPTLQTLRQQQAKPLQNMASIRMRLPIDKAFSNPSPPSNGPVSTAFRCRDTIRSGEDVNKLRKLPMLQDALMQALWTNRHNFPMCFVLDRDHNHRAESCALGDCGREAQKQFRGDKANNWGENQACFFCNLPRWLCAKVHKLDGAKPKACGAEPYRDTVRGILALLTANASVRAAAVEVAAWVFSGYSLPDPQGVGQMGEHWKATIKIGSVACYRAFPAVAAVILMADGYF
ncbi:hypothetical protein V8E36_002643 [Tilletia maclaganii]